MVPIFRHYPTRTFRNVDDRIIPYCKVYNFPLPSGLPKDSLGHLGAVNIAASWGRTHSLDSTCIGRKIGIWLSEIKDPPTFTSTAVRCKPKGVGSCMRVVDVGSGIG